MATSASDLQPILDGWWLENQTRFDGTVQLALHYDEGIYTVLLEKPGDVVTPVARFGNHLAEHYRDIATHRTDTNE